MKYTDKFYLFGCLRGKGHFLYDSNGRGVSEAGPFKENEIDGTFCPKLSDQDQAFASLVYKNGWTIMAMWDRSIDKRFASNIAFIAEGQLTQQQMWETANHYFPDRIKLLAAAPDIYKRSCAQKEG